MALERAHRRCCWCEKELGFVRKEYCDNACKQAHYRYRRRGMKLPRTYKRRLPN